MSLSKHLIAEAVWPCLSVEKLEWKFFSWLPTHPEIFGLGPKHVVYGGGKRPEQETKTRTVDVDSELQALSLLKHPHLAVPMRGMDSGSLCASEAGKLWLRISGLFSSLEGHRAMVGF